MSTTIAIMNFHVVFPPSSGMRIHSKQACYPLAFRVPAALMAVSLSK